MAIKVAPIVIENRKIVGLTPVSSMLFRVISWIALRLGWKGQNTIH